jgi:hypothetical protein
MRLVVAAVLFAALAAPAFAQSPPLGGQAASPLQNLGSDIAHPKSIDEHNREVEAERSYKAGLKKIPDPKNANDPWGSVRAADQKASQAKTPPASKKAKAE